MTARFAYWWPGAGEHGEPLAFYRNSIGSDVTAETLLASGHPISLTPTFSTWQNMVGQKSRCGLCWAVTRGRYDFRRHLDLNHRALGKVA